MVFGSLSQSMINGMRFSRAGMRGGVYSGQLMGRRMFASEVGPRTETSSLSNGFSVASETVPGSKTATVGVWVDSGSRAETKQNNGTAHFFEHLAFKGTKNRSQSELETQVENMGAQLHAYTSREQTVYYARCLSEDVDKVVEIISDIVQNPKLDESAIERERPTIIRESEEIEKQYEEYVFDHLHATAFQGEPLGRTILGPIENIQSIQKSDLSKYLADNYRSDRMLLVGAGGVDHADLVSLGEKYFNGLKSSETPVAMGMARGPKPRFTGSEVRIRDDTVPTANIAIAVEGVSWKDPDYLPMLVAQAIVGNYDRAVGSSGNQGSSLASFVHKHGLANSFMSFSSSYADTGLWGVYLVTENITRIDDLVHFTLKEWNRLSYQVTNAEVERAKAQLRASMLLTLDNTNAIFEDIGRQMTTTGRRMTPAEINDSISKITPNDIKRVAQKKIWDQDIAISAFGSIEGLFDYTRLRNLMSSNLI